MEKLKSALESPRFILATKTLIFGSLLNWIHLENLSFFSAVLFLAAGFVFYLRPLFNSATFVRSFFILMGLSLILPQSLALEYRWMAVVLLTLIFGIILGLKELILVRRSWWHQNVFFVLIYLILISVVLNNFADGFLWAAILATASFTLLFSELVYVNAEILFTHSVLAGFVLGFVSTQGLWVTSLLPIGFFGAANVVALGSFCFAELAMHFYSHTLNWKIVAQRLGIFITLILFVLLSAKWKL